MKKSDLRTGMQVEQRGGTRKVVMLGTKEGDVIVEVNGYIYGELNNYRTDLTNMALNSNDIMKVYEGGFPNKCIVENMDISNCIWKREPKQINMTVAEIEAKLDIKNLYIVKEEA